MSLEAMEKEYGMPKSMSSLARNGGGIACGHMTARQRETPYLDALCEYADRDPARLHVPGHKGGLGADEGLLRAVGERALRLDIPALDYGIDLGATPTPFERAQGLAAEAWGSRRAWFRTTGASQGTSAPALALAHQGRAEWRRRNAPSRTTDALALSALRPPY